MIGVDNIGIQIRSVFKQANHHEIRCNIALSGITAAAPSFNFINVMRVSTRGSFSNYGFQR